MSDWLNHASFLGHLGKYGQKISDPLAWIGGDKWTHLTSDVLPGKVNEGLSHVMKPFEYVDKTINPVRKIPIVNRIGNIVAAKPGDAGAIAAGAYFGGSALLGAGGAGGAGAGAAGGGYAGEVGLTGADLGTGAAAGDGLGGAVAAGGGGADAAGLAAADSAAVDAEGAVPGLTQGYGAAPAASSSGFHQMPQMGGGQKQREPLRQAPIATEPTLEERERALQVQDPNLVTSSRAKKTPVAVSVAAVAHAGATGKDQVSQNGVHIGAIRALDKQIAQLEAAARTKGIKV